MVDRGAGPDRSILIVGCGAIGGIFAALLDPVAKVVAFDANADHVRAINERGLRVVGVTHGATARVARIEATDDPARLAGRRFDAVELSIQANVHQHQVGQWLDLAYFGWRVLRGICDTQHL